MDEKSAREIIDKKKTSIFRSLLRKPNKADVHLHSLKLFYEALLVITGKYSADYFRKANHTITVPNNVTEVILGEGVFPIRSKSGFRKAIAGKGGKNKVDLELEEHVFISKEDKIVLDHHGNEIRFPYKLDSKTIENYPKRVLEKNEPNVKKPEITYDAAIERLISKLQNPIESNVRDLNDDFSISEIQEVYTPIYEARLTGPKNKVGLLRLDAVRKKQL